MTVVQGWSDLTVAPPLTGKLYLTMVLLHVICAVGGPGVLAYRAFALEMARHRGGAAMAGTLSVLHEVSIVGEALLYGTFILGWAAIAAGGHWSRFDHPWIYTGLGLWVVMVGVLHGLVRPAERRYRSALVELAGQEPMKPPSRPPQLEELDGLHRRIGAGMGVFNVCLVAALYAMVFKP